MIITRKSQYITEITSMMNISIENLTYHRGEFKKLPVNNNVRYNAYCSFINVFITY